MCNGVSYPLRAMHRKANKAGAREPNKQGVLFRARTFSRFTIENEEDAKTNYGNRGDVTPPNAISRGIVALLCPAQKAGKQKEKATEP